LQQHLLFWIFFEAKSTTRETRFQSGGQPVGEKFLKGVMRRHFISEKAFAMARGIAISE